MNQHKTNQTPVPAAWRFHSRTAGFATLRTFAAFFLMFLFLGAAAVSAQPNRSIDRGPGTLLTPELIDSIGLSDAQLRQFIDLRAAHMEEIQALRLEFREGDLTPNQFSAKREAMQQNHLESIRGIMNDSQFEIYMKIRNDRQEAAIEWRNQRAEIRGTRGGNPNRQQPGMRGGNWRENRGDAPGNRRRDNRP